MPFSFETQSSIWTDCDNFRDYFPDKVKFDEAGTLEAYLETEADVDLTDYELTDKLLLKV